jgi:hypothetical protein
MNCEIFTDFMLIRLSRTLLWISNSMHYIAVYDIKNAPKLHCLI